MTPYNETNLSMTSASTGNSAAFQIGGKGPLRIAVALPDTTSANGDFAVLLSDREAGTFVTRGTFDERDNPTLTKTAGAALAGELVIQAPASTWCKLRYTRSSGGAAGEITAVVQSWD